MSTRSRIIVHCADGKWRGVYCHADGYISHNGRMLFKRFTSRDKCSALVAGGDMSKLGPSIDPTPLWGYGWGEGHEFSIYKKRPKGASFGYNLKKHFEGKTRYYRLRTEPHQPSVDWDSIKPTEGDSLYSVWPQSSYEEFVYVFCNHDGGGFKWWVGDPNAGTQDLRDLGEVIAGKVSIFCDA